jgi:hypothetical protein
LCVAHLDGERFGALLVAPGQQQRRKEGGDEIKTRPAADHGYPKISRTIKMTAITR